MSAENLKSKVPPSGGQGVYFASDFHLGIDAKLTSKEREKLIVRWLDSIKETAKAIYIVGDIFDFYFEYKTVVPKGYVRIMGKLAELSDAGIEMHFFIGNHDMWIFNYFEEELGIKTHRKPIVTTILGKKFLIGHGDGLGPNDYGYKILKKVFANPICQWLFARLHPNIAIGLGNFWSQRSKDKNIGTDDFEEQGIEKQHLYHYAERKLKEQPDIDFFIFGHRHIPIDYTLSNGKSRYLNLGQWLFANSYVIFDGNDCQHKFFENEDERVYP